MFTGEDDLGVREMRRTAIGTIELMVNRIDLMRRLKLGMTIDIPLLGMGRFAHDWDYPPLLVIALDFEKGVIELGHSSRAQACYARAVDNN
jgi:hypothetical protein